MSWAGNDKVGEGKMTVVESQPNDAVKLKVDFVKPFEGTSNSDSPSSRRETARPSPGPCRPS